MTGIYICALDTESMSEGFRRSVDYYICVDNHVKGGFVWIVCKLLRSRL